MAIVISSWADYVRFVIGAVAFFDIGLLFAIHWKTSRTIKLPLHERVGGSSFALLMFVIVVRMYQRFGTSFAPLTAVTGIAVFMALWALIRMDRYYDIDRRIERHMRKSDEATIKILMAELARQKKERERGN